MRRNKWKTIMIMMMCFSLLCTDIRYIFAVDPTTENENSEQIELYTEVNGTTITITGDASSFDSDLDYSLEASVVDDDSISNAIKQVAEQKDTTVQGYQAFDIKLMANGEEVQPLGPVQVKFTGKKVSESINSENTAIEVYHVDDAGSAANMEASCINDSVAIETAHFSVFVMVNMEQLGGYVNLNIQHWANLTELVDVDGRDGLIESATYDGIPFNATASLNSTIVFREIYSTDKIRMDNQAIQSIENLSKVCLSNVNKSVNKNYELSEIWILQDGKSEDSMNASDWDVYSASDNTTITLSKDTTMRCVYTPVVTEGSLVQDVTFFDYNVTDGVVSNGNMVGTINQGINSPENYIGGDTSNRLAVGQIGGGIDHSYHNVMIGDKYVNSTNGIDVATGIVTGVTEDDVIYNGFYDAGLFNKTEKKGKQIFENFNLVFKQTGDTYILSGVDKDGTLVMDGLDVFSEVYDSGSTHIFSNNFFPMDYCDDYDGKDPLLGDVNNIYTNADGDWLGISDDNYPHNWFFGMRYDFEFTIGDYTGPLYYYFRGDDDFWLFIDGKLVTDIGGIHSSVGATVDLGYLRDEDLDKVHYATIVYTERGGFGSSCYMQFTLPNVNEKVFSVETEKTTVTINKEWDDYNSPYRPLSVAYQLMYKADDSDEYLNYRDAVIATAENNWSYTWTDLPLEGYSYKIVELNVSDGYEAIYENDGVFELVDGTYTATVTNKLVDTTSVVATKEWIDRNNYAESRPKNIDFILLSRQAGSTVWGVYPGNNNVVTLDGKVDDMETTAWSCQFANLPITWNGMVLEYTVREVVGFQQVEGDSKWEGKDGWEYTTTYSENTNGYPSAQSDIANEVTVTNKLICSKLTITKRIDELDINTGTKTFWFLVEGPNGYSKEVKIYFSEEDATLVGLDNIGKTITLDALQPGEYTIKELPVKGYDLIEVGLDGSLVPSDDKEKIPFSTTISCELVLENTTDVYFWNLIKDEPYYTINNSVKFDGDGNIILENTRQESGT